MQLNTMMQKYKQNQEEKNKHFLERKDAMVESVKMHATKPPEEEPTPQEPEEEEDEENVLVERCTVAELAD
jgi:hypothetical protein